MDVSRIIAAVILSVPLWMLLGWILWALPPEGVTNHRRMRFALTGTSLAMLTMGGVAYWLKTIH